MSRAKLLLSLTRKCVSTRKYFKLFNNALVLTQIISRLFDDMVRKLALAIYTKIS